MDDHPTYAQTDITRRQLAVGALAVATVPAPPNFSTPENAALMKEFCSLGARCELGIVQRRCGAEPLDLLRWAGTNLRVLMHLLRERFVGIGKDLRLKPAGQEYMVVNDHYGLQCHAWVLMGAMEPDRLLQREAARLPRMAEILIEHLTQADRIFVRVPERTETQDDMTNLFSAIRRYGAGTLLVVREDENRTGAVERIGDGSLLGYIDHYSNPASIPTTTHVAPWVEICRNALALMA